MKLSEEIANSRIEDIDLIGWSEKVGTIENLGISDSDVQSAKDAAFSVSGTPKASRAMHILIQEIPPLRLFRILRTIKEFNK